jgi:hypothetical protein
MAADDNYVAGNLLAGGLNKARPSERCRRSKASPPSPEARRLEAVFNRCRRIGRTPLGVVKERG